MTDTYKPEIGDRVRVTAKAPDSGSVESTVDAWGSYFGKAAVDSGNATVDLIERKDDPSTNLAGTVRRSPGKGVWAKAYGGPWYWFGPVHDGYGLERTNSQVAGWEVIGAVPGTPAAEKQAADELSRQAGDEERKPEGYPFPLGTKVRGYRPWTETWETGYLIKPRYGRKLGMVTVGKTPDAKAGNYLRASDLKRVDPDPFEEPW